MTFRGARSAVVVPIRLPAALESIRRRHVDNANLGVPAHVTLLFPFVPPPSIDGAVLARLAGTIARRPAFDVHFREVEAFEPGPTEEGVVWLRPEPGAPFVAMTEALVAAFPGYLPYGGLHDEVIPHLTLANVHVDVPAIRTEASTTLPFRRRAGAAALLVEGEGGRWRAVARLALG